MTLTEWIELKKKEVQYLAPDHPEMKAITFETEAIYEMGDVFDNSKLLGGSISFGAEGGACHFASATIDVEGIGMTLKIKIEKAYLICVFPDDKDSFLDDY